MKPVSKRIAPNYLEGSPVPIWVIPSQSSLVREAAKISACIRVGQSAQLDSELALRLFAICWIIDHLDLLTHTCFLLYSEE